MMIFSTLLKSINGMDFIVITLIWVFLYTILSRFGNKNTTSVKKSAPIFFGGKDTSVI